MCRKKILLTGGAGFIGSHINQVLIESGYQTVIIDNLCNSRKITNTKAIFMPGDLRSSAFLTKVFTKYNFEAVIHLAAHIDVGESFLNPNKYYNHNVLGSINLLNFMLKHQVLKLIFSSSAAVYGHPQSSIITEQHPLKPISPYGKSKLIIENILEDLAISHSLKYCSLRYFNAAGGDPAGNLKNYQKKPSNLIPILIYAVKERIPQISIFGDDHSTKDGTCVRDYIHVHDLAIAHKKALEKDFVNHLNY